MEFRRIPHTHLADDGFGNLIESPGGGWIRQANWFWYWLRDYFDPH